MSAPADLVDAVPEPDRSLWLWSAIASLSALLFCLLVVTPAFELDDDIRMATIASGEEAGGLPDHHLIFTSSLIGGPLASLYLLAPDVPWYAAYLYSIQFVAWTCLLRVLLAGREFGPALAWFAILFLVVGVRLVANVQFTTTAWLLGLAGVVVGLSPLLTPQRIGGANWGGPVLLGCATLIRFDASVLIVCLAALPLLALSSEGWGDRGRRVMGLGLGVVVAIVVWKVDIAWNYSTPEWLEFIRFHAAFSAIYDYQLLESIRNELELARRVGWSPNDLKLLGEWNYLDNTVYTTDRLVQFRTLIVTEGLPEAGSRWQRAMFWSPYLKQLVLPVVAANLLVLLLPLRGQVGRLWLLAAAASVAIGSLLLFGLGRFPPHVALPTALTPPLLVSLLANGGSAAGRIAPRQALLLIAVVAFGIWSLVPVVSRGRDLAFRRGEFQKLVAALPDGETAVLDVALADRLCALPLSPFPRRLTERLFSWGWHIRTPTFVERANRAGVPLEHVTMVDRPVSFVMRPEILGAIQLSLLEHHGMVTKVVYSGQFGQLPAYRLERVDIPDRAQ